MQTKITIDAQGKITIEALNGPATTACSLHVRRLLTQLQAAGLVLEVEQEESRPPAPLASADSFGDPAVLGDIDASASATAL